MINAVNHAKIARISALFVTKFAFSSMWPVALAALLAGCSSSEPYSDSPGNAGRPKEPAQCCPCTDSSVPDVHANDSPLDNRVATLATVSFSTPFVLAGANWQNDEYRTQHQDGVRDETAFVGSYHVDSATIPPEQSTTISVALRNLSGYLEGSVPLAVLQRSSREGQVVSPVVLMTLAPESVVTGVMEVTPRANSHVRVMLLKTSGAGDYCVSAVGIGEINVTNAENLQAEDGGKLDFTGKNIVMYHPTKTPDGDVTTQVGAVTCGE